MSFYVICIDSFKKLVCSYCAKRYYEILVSRHDINLTERIVFLYLIVKRIKKGLLFVPVITRKIELTIKDILAEGNALYKSKYYFYVLISLFEILFHLLRLKNINFIDNIDFHLKSYCGM